MQEIGCERSPWLFPNNIGGKLCSKTVQQMVKRYGVAAGIDPAKVRISPHTLRHTYAVTFARNGGDAFTLQKILGHSSLDTTRRYCELADEDVMRRQRELSPVASLGLASGGQRRIKRRPQPRRRLTADDPARASTPWSPGD
ncbi:MAG TPA: tyrosine-type recombinase/integrase [Armatimonadota bacterium]|nr:tyrosine-type recombinase/integrase [Armatimonadota bacterium]